MELYDYWENNIKQEEEDQEADGEAYATYERAGNGAKKHWKETRGKRRGNKAVLPKQWRQESAIGDGSSDLDPNWTNDGANGNDEPRP